MSDELRTDLASMGIPHQTLHLLDDISLQEQPSQELAQDTLQWIRIVVSLLDSAAKGFAEIFCQPSVGFKAGELTDTGGQ
jgi:hypothetical protein